MNGIVKSWKVILLLLTTWKIKDWNIDYVVQTTDRAYHQNLSIILEKNLPINMHFFVSHDEKHV